MLVAMVFGTGMYLLCKNAHERVSQVIAVYGNL